MASPPGYFLGRLLGSVVTISLSSFYWGYYLAVLASPISNIAYTLGWGSNTRLFTALFSALYPLGAALGAVVGGTLTKTKGRRKVLVWTAVFGICSSVIHAIPWTPTFAIGRFCCGIAGGACAAVPSMFIAEISPKAVSGKSGISVSFFATFGALVSYVLGLPLPVKGSSAPMNNWWMFMMSFPALVLTLQLCLFQCKYVQESSSWLRSQGRQTEADEADSFFNIHSAKLLESVTPHKESEISAEAPPTFKQLLSFSQPYRRMMVLGVTLLALVQWCGINAVMNYSVLIFEETSSVPEARLLSCLIAFVNVVTTFAGAPLVDRIGRRPLLIAGLAGMMVSHFCLGLTSLYVQSPVTAIVFICCFITAFESCYGPVVWIYCSEILNDKAMAIAVGFQWLCTAVVELTFPYIIIPGLYIAFFLYGSFCLVGTVFAIVLVKETKPR
jgi:SP family facilitated glucose transporter-like MFS transporter 1